MSTKYTLSGIHGAEGYPPTSFGTAEFSFISSDDFSFTTTQGSAGTGLDLHGDMNNIAIVASGEEVNVDIQAQIATFDWDSGTKSAEVLFILIPQDDGSFETMFFYLAGDALDMTVEGMAAFWQQVSDGNANVTNGETGVNYAFSELDNLDTENVSDTLPVLSTVPGFNLIGSDAENTFDLSDSSSAAYARSKGGDDKILLGSGNDVVEAGDGNDKVFTREGNDYVLAGRGNDHVAASGGDDTIDGGEGNDSIGGGLGNDHLEGGWGEDVIGAGKGNDTVYAGDGDDRAYGNFGDDVIFGGDGNDNVAGSQGDDKVNGDAGNDNMGGGYGADTLSGGLGNDTVGAGQQDDLVKGNAGDDSLNGNNGNDSIDGGDGNDTINGGDHNDTLTGGDGADVFYFRVFNAGTEDRITDFTSGEDVIQMRGNFAGLNITDHADGLQIEKNGHVIILEGVDSVTADDFDFI